MSLIIKRRRATKPVNDEEVYDAEGTPAQLVLQNQFLLAEIAQWELEAYRVIARLNRAGGILALGRTPFYKNWRLQNKRRNVIVKENDRGWDAYVLLDNNLSRWYVCDSEPGSLWGGTYKTVMWFKDRWITLNKAHNGKEHIEVNEASSLRSGIRLTSRKGTKAEIELFKRDFEKYKNGPFPEPT